MHRTRLIPTRPLFVLAILLATSTHAPAADPDKPLGPLFAEVDLSIGEEQTVRLPDGTQTKVRLVKVDETKDPVRQAVRKATVTLAIDGKEVAVTSAMYTLPRTVGKVQVDCPVTRGLPPGSKLNVWALTKDARVRLWPAGSPWVQPGTFMYPARQRWFASDTQMANEPAFVDGGEAPGDGTRIYYHYGLDMGGAEGLVDVVAATDALVVSAGKEVLPGYEPKPGAKITPVSPRYDVVYAIDGRGWCYRYSHLKEIDPAVKPGAKVKMGQKIGVLGKEGTSGGWAHLHFDIHRKDDAGDWRLLEGYAFLWEAYQREFPTPLVAVARPHHLARPGDKVTLDATRSKGDIKKYDWTFTDGTTATGANPERTYKQPGAYSEVLKVTDAEGRVSYDFAVVQVVDPAKPVPPTIHACYFPTQNIKVGDPITFKVRTFRSVEGTETIDFGDGTPPDSVRSDGTKEHDPNGYAVTKHAYAKPGDYVVKVERSTKAGVKATARLWVHVDARGAGEKLPNGIILPDPWPPRPAAIPDKATPPAYIKNPPAVIPIDLGRQLFVDDFLIAETTLKRTYHQGKFHPKSPVLKPDRDWERKQKANTGASAMPYSDGVWYDPADRLFKLWYKGGPQAGTCLATSKDGLTWEKPALDVVKGTNIVLPDFRDSSTVWLDQFDPDPKRRYKMFRALNARDDVGWRLLVHVSPDGIHWSGPVGGSGWSGDRSTAFFNPFRKVWVYSLRDGWEERPRARRYAETPDIVTYAKWKKNEPGWWAAADELDPPRPDLKQTPQLYNLDCVAYESLLLGMFTMWRGQPEFRHKPNDLVLGYSRDGWNWHRPDRRPFATGTDRIGDWNYTNIASAGGCCLIVGDELYFYVSGRAGMEAPKDLPRPTKTEGDGKPSPFTKDGDCSTGLVVLRRDGFASMDADATGGSLTTRPVRFNGKHLFVNLQAADGELKVEALDEAGKVLLTSKPVKGDKTLLAVPWQGADDLAALAGKTVRFRFTLRGGKLYSFWVSPDRSGASGGFVGAGGPGFTGPTDTVGAGR